MNAYVKPPVGLSSRTVTAKEAIEQGSTPGFLLTIANSLERLGRQYNSTPYEDKEERRSMRLQADENFKQATHLRRVAKDVRRMWKDLPGVAQKLSGMGEELPPFAKPVDHLSMSQFINKAAYDAAMAEKSA